jgi:hypothetical protein
MIAMNDAPTLFQLPEQFDSHAQSVQIIQHVAALHTVARHALVARGAHVCAEQRGFVPEDELDDWLTAEVKIAASDRDDELVATTSL